MLASYFEIKSYDVNISTFTFSRRRFSTRRAVLSILTLLCISVIAIIIIISVQGNSKEIKRSIFSINKRPIRNTARHGNGEHFADTSTLPSTLSTTQSLNDVTTEGLRYVNADQHIAVINESAESTPTSAAFTALITEGGPAAELSSISSIFEPNSTRQDKVPTESYFTVNGEYASVTIYPPTVTEEPVSIFSTQALDLKQDITSVYPLENNTLKQNEPATQNENDELRYVEGFYGKYAYLLFGDRATLDKARETCERFNSTLIYIESTEEEEMFNDLVLDRMSLVSSAPVPTGQQNSTSVAHEMTMWTAGYVSSASLTRVHWNISSIRSSYEHFCPGEISAMSAKLDKTGNNQQKTYRIVKEFRKRHNAKWRETHCWRLIDDKALQESNTTMHFACKHRPLREDTKSSGVKLLAPLRQMNFFTLATYEEAEALCHKSNATLISIESEEDERAIDRRVLERRAEFLSDPSIPSEALWNTRSPWMVWTGGVYDLSSVSMFPWTWANRDPPTYGGKFCDGALDRAGASRRSRPDAATTGAVHIVKDYSGGGNCWELLDARHARLGNYTLPVMCQSRVRSRLFARKN